MVRYGGCALLGRLTNKNARAHMIAGGTCARRRDAAEGALT
jgi:hypothetical protein